MSTRKKVRILSIDGGGSWALIPVRALMAIYGENAKGHEVLGDFDYVAANSGGSLVVAGLICNFSLNQILNFFIQEANRNLVFSRLPFYHRPANFLSFGKFGFKYSSEEKLMGLKKVMQTAPNPKIADTALSAIQIPKTDSVLDSQQSVRFVFMAYNYDRDRASFMRSYKSLAGAVGTQASSDTLLNAVHASTNAPINYFDKPANLPGEKRYWDGGLTGYNNPVLAAVAEALANGAKAEDIGVLSLGTGTVFLPLRDSACTGPEVVFKKHETSGLFNDIKKAATTILKDPPDAHSFLAHLMLGAALPTTQCSGFTTPVVRMNPLIQPVAGMISGAWYLPSGFDENEFDQLVQLDMDATKNEEVNLISKFCSAWINGSINNQSVRPASDLSCEIGYPTFSAAQAAWTAM
ncbi:MAG: patatin-like phospholipase family protein [Polaromonas sp.]